MLWYLIYFSNTHTHMRTLPHTVIKQYWQVFATAMWLYMCEKRHVNGLIRLFYHSNIKRRVFERKLHKSRPKQNKQKRKKMLWYAFERTLSAVNLFATAEKINISFFLHLNAFFNEIRHFINKIDSLTFFITFISFILTHI